MEIATGWEVQQFTAEQDEAIRLACAALLADAERALVESYGAEAWAAAKPGVRSQARLIVLAQRLCAPEHHPGGFDVLEIATAFGTALGYLTAHLDEVELGYAMRYVGLGVQSARAHLQGPKTEGEA